MNTCETCEYWGIKIIGSKEETKFRACTYVKQEWDCFDWIKGGNEYGLKKKYENQKAVVMDGSSYYAELKTKKDFGCNQYKEGITNDTL